MFESLIGLLTALLEILSKIEMNKSNKQSIGRSLTNIYTGLININENGEEILQYLGLFKDTRYVLLTDTTLIRLLTEQSTLIKTTRKAFDNSRITTISRIHLPQLTDMQVLLHSKAKLIAVLSEQLKVRGMTKFLALPIERISGYIFGFGIDRPLKLLLPTTKQLDNAYRDLDELKRLAELLRHFLIENFEISEII